MKTCFLLVLCSTLLASCKQTGENHAVVMPDAETGTASTVPRVYPRATYGVKIDMSQYDGETPVYEVRLRTYTYVVNGVLVGRSERCLREFLACQKKGAINFYSEYTAIIPDAEEELDRILTEQSSQVKQIWGCDFTAAGNDDDETRDYVIRLYAHVHTVNNVVVGNDRLSSLRDYLACQKKGIILFESERKFVPKTEQEYADVFAELGFQVKQFITPYSDGFLEGNNSQGLKP
jgi:hypothetical protein